MSLLLSLVTVAILAPQQKPDPERSQSAPIPRIEGIPAASKLAPLKGLELDVSKAAMLKFRPIKVNTFAFTKDLRPEIAQRVGRARNQGDRPTGTIHAFTFLAEFVFSKKANRNGVDLSEEYLNAVANSVGGNVQDGDHLLNAQRAFAAAGICNEAILPYRATFALGIPISSAARVDGMAHRMASPVWIRPYLQLTIPPQNLPGQPGWPTVPGQGVTPAMLQGIKVQLTMGYPVAVMVRWPNEPFLATFEVAGIDLMRMPSMQQAPYSKGIALVGFKDDSRFPGGGVFVFRNSEGPNWGDGGYGYMSYNYVRNLAFAVLALR